MEKNIRKLVGNILEKAISDEDFSNNKCLIGNVSLIALLSKFNDAYIEVEVKVKQGFEYIKKQKRN